MNFEALFLGPQAENHKFFKEILNFLIDEHVHWRRNFHPNDIQSITLQDQGQEDFITTQQKIQETLLQLSSALKQSSLPWHSPRYLGHMVSDLLMPAHLAYILTMLYNPNNVAWEASPATTKLELQVGIELAQMIGFDKDKAFGHITSGGTVANIEALWIARNLKSIPFAIKKVRPDLVEGMSDKMLMNFSPRKTLELVRMVDEQIDEIKKYSVRGEGVKSFEIGKVFVPGTRHYSWDKMVDILGIGANNLVVVNVTDNYRMDINDLEKKIQETIDNGEHILAVVGVVGTTEEGTVDPIDEIVALRKKFEAKGTSFYIHIDGAYGGYIRSLFIDESYNFIPYNELRHSLHEKKIIEESYNYPPMEIYNSFKSFEDVDSVTIDPHKLGYIPYQAGAIVFRDKHVRNIISYFAPYIFEEGNEYQNPLLLGSYILEGSKSGAAAAAVWTANKVVGLHLDGYGKIIGESIEGALRLYNMMIERSEFKAKDKLYRIVPLLKPDTNIVMYAFNEVGNESLEEMNILNRNIKEKLYYKPGKFAQQYEFMISSTSFSFDDYKDIPLHFLKKLSIPESEWKKTQEVFILRSTIMSPYLTLDFTEIDYLSKLFECFEKILLEI
jgi:tyrosine decarboxylase